MATMHRVRAPPPPPSPIAAGYQKGVVGVDGEDEDEEESTAKFGRFSVPFFFEPGEGCLVQSVDVSGGDRGVIYGDHVRAKMESFVEYKRDQI